MLNEELRLTRLKLLNLKLGRLNHLAALQTRQGVLVLRSELLGICHQERKAQTLLPEQLPTDLA